jgi:hypothetical protein
VSTVPAGAPTRVENDRDRQRIGVMISTLSFFSLRIRRVRSLKPCEQRSLQSGDKKDAPEGRQSGAKNRIGNGQVLL